MPDTRGGEPPEKRGAWAGICPYPIQGRDNAKPRERGLTMVIDKGVGAAQTADMLDLCGDYVDLLKLAFGTSAFYSEDALRHKVAAAEAHGVATYPGGTFLNVAASRPGSGTLGPR